MTLKIQYTVEFDGTVPTATGAYTEELTARKTFNIFRAWNANLSPQKYGCLLYTSPSPRD